MVWLIILGVGIWRWNDDDGDDDRRRGLFLDPISKAVSLTK